MLDTGILLPRLRMTSSELMRRQPRQPRRRQPEFIELMRRQMPKRAPRRRQFGMLRPFVGLHARQPTGGGAGADLICDAADFDGSNDWLSRASAFSNQVDSKVGILSLWLNSDSFALTRTWLNGVNGSTDSFNNDEQASSTIPRLTGIVSSNAELLLDSDTALSTSTWYHLLYSWDGATGAMHFYLNDVDRLNGGGSFANNVNQNWDSIATWALGAINGGTSKFDGGIAEPYLNIATYQDMSNSTNRRRFRSAGGKPVNLGTDGSAPTGSVPLFYQHLDDGESAANFATNRAGNGNWTVNGTLTPFASSPSD